MTIATECPPAVTRSLKAAVKLVFPSSGRSFGQRNMLHSWDNSGDAPLCKDVEEIDLYQFLDKGLSVGRMPCTYCFYLTRPCSEF